MIGPTPEQYTPPLTPWGQTWRLLLCVAVSTLAWWEVSQAQWDQARGLFWLDLALGVLAFGLVFLRRRWPFAIAGAVTLMSLVSAASAGPGGLAFVSLATRRKYPQIAVVAFLSILCSQLFFYLEPQPNADPPWVNFTVVVTITIALAATGMYIGSRRELIWSLHERARQAEAAAELRMDQARSAERERIGREMHDVLAHRISLVAMHSGALAFRDDLPPEQVRETAALIQAKSHEALSDLRQVLGLLREEDVPNRPQPTLADLPALVAEAGEGGMRVEFTSEVDGTPPEQVGRTVYRIVQEALTNARKHGGGDQATVTVQGGAGGGIDVTVRNGKRFGAWESTAPTSGLGLVGLRERAELAGGRLTVEETAEAFTLHGWLPWPP